MLTLRDPRHGFGRREFLRIGGLGLGGLSLANLMAAKSDAAASLGRRGIQDRSVIFLFMHGGPSQFETFDPKMDAPVGTRSVTGEIATSIPGVTFGGTYEKLAKLANRMTIVRSYVPGDAKHDIKPIVSSNTLNANLGSLYSRVAGTTHPITGMPTCALIGPQSVSDDTQSITKNFGNLGNTGSLGQAYAPFMPGAGGNLQQSMELSIPRDRLDDRRGLLSRLDALKRTLDAGGQVEGMDKFQAQAFQTILSGVSNALDLKKEDPKVIERYDTSQLVNPNSIKRQFNNFKNYVDHGKTLGKMLLLGRRLCEAGCGFVTITSGFVWDNHADNNNVGVYDGAHYCGLPFDHAVSTFLEDLRERGLSDKILLVCTGEIGRTPKINARGGRDHWGNLAPLMLAGGGMPRGRVIGQSTRDGGEALSEPNRIENLVSTIMHSLLDVPQVRLLTNLPIELQRLITESSPIPGLS